MIRDFLNQNSAAVRDGVGGVAVMLLGLAMIAYGIPFLASALGVA